MKGAIMKKTRKVFALLLTVAMCMAMSVSAFAVGTDPSSEITTKTYELDNGILVTVTTAPNEITPMPLAYDRVIEALASPTARHTFPLESGEGSRCSAQIWNDSTDGTKMQVSFSVTLNGNTSTLPTEIVAAGKNTTFSVEDKKGNDLVGKTVTNIAAVDASSVRYTYLIEQS